MSSLHACLILTRLGQCLVHCDTGGWHLGRPLPRPAALCTLLATMIDCSGSPTTAYVEVCGFGIVVLTGFRVIVAIICNSEVSSVPTARLLGMQVLNAFGKLHHAQITAIDDAKKRELDQTLTSYTFHSATQDPAVGSVALGETCDVFRPFVGAYLQPLLLRPSLEEMWLAPLLDAQGALRALIVNPSPLQEQEVVLLASEPRPGSSLALSAGPNMPSVWASVLASSRSVMQVRPVVADKLNRKTRLAVSHSLPALPRPYSNPSHSHAMPTSPQSIPTPSPFHRHLVSIPALTSPSTAITTPSPHRHHHTGVLYLALQVIAFPAAREGAHCLHVAVRPLRLVPAGACLVLFYQAPPPPPPPLPTPLPTPLPQPYPQPSQTTPPQPESCARSSGGDSPQSGCKSQPLGCQLGQCRALPLADSAAPVEIRASLHAAARTIAAAFPASVTELRTLAELRDASNESDPSSPQRASSWESPGAVGCGAVGADGCGAASAVGAEGNAAQLPSPVTPTKSAATRHLGAQPQLEQEVASPLLLDVRTPRDDSGDGGDCAEVAREAAREAALSGTGRDLGEPMRCAFSEDPEPSTVGSRGADAHRPAARPACKSTSGVGSAPAQPAPAQPTPAWWRLDLFGRRRKK